MKGAEELSQTGVPHPGRKAGLPGNLVEQWMAGLGVGWGGDLFEWKVKPRIPSCLCDQPAVSLPLF